MRSTRLSDLNVREVVDYGGQPPVQNRYATPLECHGYCVSCEESGLLARTAGRLDRLDLMSHGCDSEDFRRILGPIPRDGVSIEASVLFLLEEPGADYGNGREVPFRGFRKQPPVYHYYWTPGCDTWPVSIADFGDNFYGPYFAYLMRRHQIHDVYITNVVKCRWVAGPGGAGHDKSPIVNHCGERFLAREIVAFAPQLALCFGGDVRKEARAFLERVAPQCRVKELLHPSYIQRRCQTHDRTPQECVDINDGRVREALQGIV